MEQSLLSRVSDSCSNSSFDKKYASHNCKKLKLELKNLKRLNGNLAEIKWLSHRIRHLIKPSHAQLSSLQDNNNNNISRRLSENFWSTCRTFSTNRLTCCQSSALLNASNSSIGLSVQVKSQTVSKFLTGSFLFRPLPFRSTMTSPHIRRLLK